MRRHLFAALLPLLLSWDQTATAQVIVDATDPGVVLDVATGYGSAQMGEDGSGDPQITGRAEGHRYVIYFYGCTDNADCDSLTFWAGWADMDVPLERINEWNAIKRWPKAYQDEEGDSIVEMNVNLDGGVTYRNLDNWFDWWVSGMDTFVDFARE